MALSGGTLKSLIQSCLSGDGANGPKLPTSCNAVGQGIVSAIVGTGFTLQGNGSDSGGGSGTGITGFNSGAAIAAALATMTSQGPKSSPYMSCVMNSCASHFGSATLSSSSASGSVVTGSYTVSAGAISASVKGLLQADGASGPQLQNFCDAIGAGVRAGLNSASGNVSGTSPAGSGTVS